MKGGRGHDAPVVMVIGGNDPVGGAGLCADIQTLAACGCHAAPVVTALTIQSSCGVSSFQAVDAGLVRRQIEAVLEDMPVAAIKTGMLASPGIVMAVSDMLSAAHGVPLVIDPVLASNMGESLSEHSLPEILLRTLGRRAQVLTPNQAELETLATVMGIEPARDAAQLASVLTTAVLVTGGDRATGASIVNRLYRHDATDPLTWEWERLPGEFHGTGCTLASALAAGLAHGLDLPAAARQAQEYTWQTLAESIGPGRCQRLPGRVSWP